MVEFINECILYLLQGITEGARNKILRKVSKLRERQKLLQDLEKVRCNFCSVLSWCVVYVTCYASQ